MEINSLGERVAAARKRAGKTQGELAQLTDYSKNTICRIEKSHSGADINQITKIGEALKCDIVWLITGQEGFKQSPQSIPIFAASQISGQQPSSDDAKGHFNYPGLEGCSYAVIINSPSMTPIIPEGALVAIKPGKVEDGKIAAIVDEWGAFQVRWQRRVDGKVFFVAENQQYPPISENKTKVLGRVVAGVQVCFY